MTGFEGLHDELRAVASGMLGESSSGAVEWDALTEAGWLGLEVAESPLTDDGALDLARTAGDRPLP